MFIKVEDGMVGEGVGERDGTGRREFLLEGEGEVVRDVGRDGVGRVDGEGRILEEVVKVLLEGLIWSRVHRQ